MPDCPEKDKRDHAIEASIVGLTPVEADELSHAIKKSKRELAPRGKGTLTSGPTSKMLQKKKRLKELKG